MEQITVVYCRVSSDAQNIKMQLSAAQPYLKTVPQRNQRLLIDDGISATKVKMVHRPQLQELLRLIKANQVESLIVYHRDRLARDFYEYLDIVDVLHKHNVNVIFTSSNQRPFDKSMFFEAIGALFAQSEGHSIARRRVDTHVQFPSSMIGYDREKTVDGVSYRLNEISIMIRQFFERVGSSQSDQEFVEILREYKSLLKRPPTRLLSILQTPFFAAVYPVRGKYETLNHVEATISLELFLLVHEKLERYHDVAEDINTDPNSSALFTPECGTCRKLLQPMRRRLGEPIMYACPDHKTNRVSLGWLNDTISKLLRDTVKKLDVNEVTQVCHGWMRKPRKKLTSAIEKARRELVVTSTEVIDLYRMSNSEERLEVALRKQEGIQGKINRWSGWLQKLDIIQIQIQHLSALVAKLLKDEMLQPEQLRVLVSLMVRHIRVLPTAAEFEINWGQFWKASDG